VNSSESYIVAITALMPLAAMMVVSQVNPYHALIVRGVLGAIAALVYTVLGAADVSLTEALVGTLLAITLYAVAVRSSMILRLGVLDGEAPERTVHPPSRQRLPRIHDGS
jgi:putative multicomponent Na+:H+ antiporter subunit B